MSDLVLDDIGQALFQGYEWLGRDLKLIDGDLAFGPTGDLLAHTHPVESFAAALKYKAQVAGNIRYDPSPRFIPRIVRDCVRALSTDPRVGQVQIVRTGWRITELGQTQQLQGLDPRDTDRDYQYFVVELRLTLSSGDIIDNLVLPIYGAGA